MHALAFKVYMCTTDRFNSSQILLIFLIINRMCRQLYCILEIQSIRINDVRIQRGRCFRRKEGLHLTTSPHFFKILLYDKYIQKSYFGRLNLFIFVIINSSNSIKKQTLTISTVQQFIQEAV